MKSLEISARVTERMLAILHEHAIFLFTKKVYLETGETYDLVARHLGIMNSEGDPEDKQNAFGKTLYDLYPDFMPLGLSHRQKDEWMQKLGEAATYATALEEVFRRHLLCSKTVHKFILHREIGSMMMEAAQKAATMYDAPPANKTLAAVRSQLLRWRHEDVISDENVCNSTVVVTAVKLREQMSAMLRGRNYYITETFPRMCREIYSAVRERVRAFLYDQRLAMAAQGNMVRQSRSSMATFILTQMSNPNERTLPLIKRVLEKATFHAYVDKMIRLEVLNKAAREVFQEQQSEEGGVSSTQSQTREEQPSSSTSQATIDLTSDEDDVAEPPQKKRKPGAVTKEVIKLIHSEYEVLDPTGTYTQPRAFTRPPPKRGHSRTFVCVPKEVALRECDEDIKVQRREEEKNEQMMSIYHETPAKRMREDERPPVDTEDETDEE